MKFVCKIHGSSFHRFACRHVVQSCEAGSALPVLAETAPKGLVCKDCLTPGVRDLLLRWRSDNDQFFDILDQLKKEIGYRALCTECLFEKTGLDRRKNSSSRSG